MCKNIQRLKKIKAIQIVDVQGTWLATSPISQISNLLMDNLSALEVELVVKFLAKALLKLETWILKMCTMWKSLSTISLVCHKCVTRKTKFFLLNECFVLSKGTFGRVKFREIKWSAQIQSVKWILTEIQYKFQCLVTPENWLKKSVL